MHKIGAITLTLLILSVLGHGQIPKSGNAFFGYSYSGGQVFNGGALGVAMNGWEGTLEGKFLPWLGGVADFDWHYGGTNTSCLVLTCPTTRFRLNGSRHSVLFGPRVSTTLGKYTPFAQALFGLSHQTDAGGGTTSSDLAFADAIGGGVDYKLVEAVSLRVEGDWLQTRLFNAHHQNMRFSTGIVFRF